MSYLNRKQSHLGFILKSVVMEPAYSVLYAPVLAQPWRQNWGSHCTP